MQGVSEAHGFMWGQTGGSGVDDAPCGVVYHPWNYVPLGDDYEGGEPQFLDVGDFV